MTRPLPKNAIVFIVVTVLLDVIGFGLIVPVLPRLLMEVTGRTVSEAAVDGGWLALAYAATQFLFAPVLGGLSDRFGRRPVLLAAIAAFGVDYVVMGFAPSLAWLFVGRLISGVCGASFTPAYAFVADVSPPERRAQNFGMVSAAFGVGFIVGPAIGGLLGELGPRAPFFVAAGLSVANFAYGWFVLPESLPPERRRGFEWRRANPLGALLHMRRHPMVPGVLAALFLWMVAHQVMPATWAFFTKLRFEWTEALIGASLAVAGAVMALSQATLLRAFVPRLGERGTALTGIAVATTGYVGYATATHGWMMFAWLSTWLFGAMVMPSTNGFLSKQVPRDSQGELQGAVACLFSLSSIVGPPLMSHLLRRFSSPAAPVRVPGAAFLASAALCTVCWFAYGLATRARVVSGGTPAEAAVH